MRAWPASWRASWLRLHPDARIRIDASWFVDMLNSLAWSDRNKALMALHELTVSRDPDLLRTLRRRALPSLVETARFRSPGHALPAFVILGRLDGLADERIHALWTGGERESVIDAAVKGSLRPE